MRACGFDVAADDFVWRGMPAIVRPLIVGRALGDSNLVAAPGTAIFPTPSTIGCRAEAVELLGELVVLFAPVLRVRFIQNRRMRPRHDWANSASTPSVSAAPR